MRSSRHTLRPSSSAKAGDPVFRGVSDGTEKPQRTGYSAFAEYDGHCEERLVRRSSTSEGGSDEAIHTFFAARWIASRSLSSGAHSRDPLARNDGAALA